MKCKNCGGELIYENGIWRCQSCGQQFSGTEYCEDIDVFIEYVENDANGRRTKDSVIAQELYYLLENHKVKSFYKRISAQDCPGKEARDIEAVALNKAKTVIVVGTSKENFEFLWQDNKESLQSKKLIPCYQGMNPYDIPKEMNSIQALQFDKVGASADLIKGILSILGREEEIENNFESLSNNAQKKNKILFLIIAFIIVVLLGVGVFVAVSNSKKPHSESVIEDNETLYKEAIAHMDAGEYADAIELFYRLGSYNDSETCMRTCYAKYAGYYHDSTSETYFQFQYFDNNGSVKVYAINSEGKRCTIDETIDFKGNICEFSYMDSEGNYGSGNIILSNDGIEVELITNEKVSDNYIPDGKYKYLLNEKMDQPFVEEVTADFLIKILNNRTTIGDLKQDGYELFYLGELDSGTKTIKLYSFKNVDVILAVSGYDQNKLYNYDYGIEEVPEKFDEIVNESDLVVIAVQGPASILIPDKIGEMSNSYSEEDVLYCPNCKFYGGGFTLNIMYNVNSYEDEIIIEVEDDTLVCVCTKESIGEAQYNELVELWDESVSNDDSDDDWEGYGGDIDGNEWQDPDALYSFALVPMYGDDYINETYVISLSLTKDTLKFSGTLYEMHTGEFFSDVNLELSISADATFYFHDEDWGGLYAVTATELIEACKDITSGYTLSIKVEGGIITKLILYFN